MSRLQPIHLPEKLTVNRVIAQGVSVDHRTGFVQPTDQLPGDTQDPGAHDQYNQ